MGLREALESLNVSVPRAHFGYGPIDPTRNPNEVSIRGNLRRKTSQIAGHHLNIPGRLARINPVELPGVSCARYKNAAPCDQHAEGTCRPSPRLQQSSVTGADSGDSSGTLTSHPQVLTV